jgi:hypothetical protein
VEVSTEAQHTLNMELQERLKKTVWMQGGCKSWYLTSLSHSENSISNSGSGSDSGRKGGGAVEGKGGVDRVAAAAAPAGDKEQAGSTRNGGSILWPGLCVEFWWRTLWPVDKAWRSGQAANPPKDAVEVGEKQYKQHSP